MSSCRLIAFPLCPPLTHTHTHMHSRTHARTHARTHTGTETGTDTDPDKHAHTCTHGYMYIRWVGANLTRPRSTSCVAMTITDTSFCHTIRQKSLMVSAVGPCVAMNAFALPSKSCNNNKQKTHWKHTRTHTHTHTHTHSKVSLWWLIKSRRSMRDVLPHRLQYLQLNNCTTRVPG